MQDLLNAGLSRHLVIQSGDAESFLAATEALLVRERPPPSREVAESLWDEAAQRFFRAPPRAIRSRAAFVKHLVVQRTALPTAWSNVISTNHLTLTMSNPMAMTLGRYVAGEKYFWIHDDAARISSLLWAASLQTATETGSIARTAVRMKLAEASANVSDTLLQQLHASLSSSIFTDGLDAFLGSFIAKLGDVTAGQLGSMKLGDVMRPSRRRGERGSVRGRMEAVRCRLNRWRVRPVLRPAVWGLGLAWTSFASCRVV